MNSLKSIILEQDVKCFYEEYWKTHDYNEWLFGTYNNENVSEDAYYNDKYEIDHYTWDIPNYKIWQDLIYERLGESFKLSDKNINVIKNIKGVIDIKVINSKKYKFQIEVNDLFNEKDFTTLMNFYGYAKDLKYVDEKYYIYEAIKPELLKEHFDYVYHVTHKSAYDKIKKYGLIPKQKNNHHTDFVNNGKRDLEYPSRIYCWKSSTDIDVIKRFARLNNRIHDRKENDIIILKINVPKYLKFYGDPAFNDNNAMFTMEPIQTKYIEVL